MCCGEKQELLHNGIEISPNSCFFLLLLLIFLPWCPFIRIFFIFSQDDISPAIKASAGIKILAFWSCLLTDLFLCLSVHPVWKFHRESDGQILFFSLSEKYWMIVLWRRIHSASLYVCLWPWASVAVTAPEGVALPVVVSPCRCYSREGASKSHLDEL